MGTVYRICWCLGKMRNKKRLTAYNELVSLFLCAQNKTRTCTTLRSLVPETSVSTDFTIWAINWGIFCTKGVLRMRLELTRAIAHHPLKVACIPISPPEQFFYTKRATSVARLSEKRDSNPRPRPWQGRALPTELFSH